MNTQLECERILLVQADFDGELDAAEAAALAGHIEQCGICLAAREQLVSVRELMKASPRYEMPEPLRDAIWAQAREVESSRSQKPSIAARLRGDANSQPKRGETSTAAASIASRAATNAAATSEHVNSLTRHRSHWRPALGWAVAAALALVTVGLVMTPRESDVGAQLVNNRIRAMQLDSHLIDVVSSDHHTVKPWFAGKVSFSPPVKELADYGLKGGRVDVVNGKPAAVLVYQAGRHVIDVYVWPTDSSIGTLRDSQQLNGFNMRHWSESGLEFWSVSDMGVDELRKFADAWQAAEPMQR